VSNIDHQESGRDSNEALPTKPFRVGAFVSFFKGYMSLSTIVIAALPFPITGTRAIPTYSSMRWAMATYASVFCFLLVGLLFYARHFLGRIMFSIPVTRGDRLYEVQVGWFPLLLLTVSFASALWYFELVLSSLSVASASGGRSEKELLDSLPLTKVPGASWLLVAYLTTFMAAEGAFVVMAIKEYMQDVLGLNDSDILHRLYGVRFSRRRLSGAAKAAEPAAGADGGWEPRA